MTRSRRRGGQRPAVVSSLVVTGTPPLPMFCAPFTFCTEKPPVSSTSFLPPIPSLFTNPRQEARTSRTDTAQRVNMAFLCHGFQGLGWALCPYASVQAYLLGLNRLLGAQAFSGPLSPSHLPPPVPHVAPFSCASPA